MNKVLSYVLVSYQGPEQQLLYGEEENIVKRLVRLADSDDTAMIILAPTDVELPATWLEMRGQDLAEAVGSLCSKVVDYVYGGRYRRILFYKTIQLLRLPNHPLFSYNHRQVTAKNIPVFPFPDFPVKVVYTTTVEEIGQENEMLARKVVKRWLEDHCEGYEDALYFFHVEYENKKDRECYNALDRYLSAGGINQTDHIFYNDLSIRVWRVMGGPLHKPSLAELTVEAICEHVEGKFIWFSTYETVGSIFAHSMRPTTTTVKKPNKFRHKGIPVASKQEVKLTPWKVPGIGPDHDATPETEFEALYASAASKSECFEDKATKKLYYKLASWIPGVFYFFPVEKPVCPEFITVSHDIAESKFNPVEKKETK